MELHLTVGLRKRYRRYKMNLRKILNRPEKPIGKLIYITNQDLFFDKLPIARKHVEHPSYDIIKRFAIINEPIKNKDIPLLKNPFWLGHSGDNSDDGKYPRPMHFWQVNNLDNYKHCYIHIDLPLFTEKDFLNKDLDDKELQERLYRILDKYKEEM
jgi:hypothetical protein